MEEEKLTEESRQAYLEKERRRYAAEESENIGTDDESGIINSDDWLSIIRLDSEAAKGAIVKQRKVYKMKSGQSSNRSWFSSMAVAEYGVKHSSKVSKHRR